MKKLSVLKKITACLVGAIAVATAFALTACGGNSKPVEKSGVAVCNAVEGIEKTEYVFCVSKKSENAQTFLNTINSVIASTDVDDLITRYSSQAAHTMNYFLGEVTIDYKTGNPLNIYTGICSPYQFSGAYGSSVDGVDMYLMVKVANNLQMKPVFNDWGYKPSYNAVKNGTGDIFASAVAKTDAVSADFYVSDVYSTGYQHIVSDKNEAFTKISQLKGMKIGVMAGRPSEAIIEEAIKNGELKDSGAELVVYDYDAEAYSGYKAQACDVIVADEFSAKVMLKSR
ncbi:MAG: transporter substrate-binding domain-containing protein [Roseburia sp.]|nr:transporter substrate-binding domain-containing protein [Roseburia sp.]